MNLKNQDVLMKLSKKKSGKVFGDKGYLVNSDLTKLLLDKGIQLITKIRSNMKNKLMALEDRLMLAKRGVIESVINVLKNVFSIEHTRHRNPKNFIAYISSALMAYAFKPSKPAIVQSMKAIS